MIIAISVPIFYLSIAVLPAAPQISRGLRRWLSPSRCALLADGYVGAGDAAVERAALRAYPYLEYNVSGHPLRPYLLTQPARR
jgi:hypothetical protein